LLTTETLKAAFLVKEVNMNSTQEVFELEKKYTLQTYKRLPVVFERGQGVFLYDLEGNSYIDFVAGIAVNSLGHSHPDWVKAVSEQAAKLVHTSNVVYTQPAIELAKRLVQLSGLDRSFLCNSGTEAVEAAIKVARKWGRAKRGEECFRFISFERGFHGRTLGALSATASEKYKKPFEPLIPGFITLPIHDHESLERELDGSVCAVIIESVQGEGGVWPTDPRCLKALRTLCDRKEVLLICDEIQTGFARTGKWFGYQHSGILPDIITLAKGMGGGFPIGAMLARGQAATILEPGDHGSTYAGNPLACAAALSVLSVIEKESLLESIEDKAAFLRKALNELCQKFPQKLDHVRGIGLMQALEFKVPIAKIVVEKGLSHGVFLNATSETTLRFVPPLIITKEQISLGVLALSETIDSL
jgi:acetylornithine/N-succinyldiaminopimelate aminotransferase